MLEGMKKMGMSVKTKRGIFAFVRAVVEVEVNVFKVVVVKLVKGKK